MPHIIHLRSAWETTASADSTQHKRRFGRPLRLKADERVWLVCERVPGAAEVFVNEQLVGRTSASGPFSVDITDLLSNRNSVLIQAESSDALGAVAIEIRSGQ